MREPVHPDDPSPFYARRFADDETASFLEHYSHVFGDAFNPRMAQFWSGEAEMRGGWQKRIAFRNGLRAALDRLMALADRHGFDIEPFQWCYRYVDGAVPREVGQIAAVRNLFQRVCIREAGRSVGLWREYDETL